MSKKILHIVTNVAHFATPNEKEPTGLWLGEITHAYDEFAKQGYEQTIISPNGGNSPIEPKSLLPIVADRAVMAHYADPDFMELLRTTQKPSDINWQDYDVIYFTGGHGVMWDFLDNAQLQTLTAQLYENGKIVASVCHGYCGLLNVKLSNGKHLMDGKKITGFSWNEEKLAMVADKVPYNIEEKSRAQGANYDKALVPFVSHVVVDDNQGLLITGQNPASAKEVALKVIEKLI